MITRFTAYYDGKVIDILNDLPLQWDINVEKPTEPNQRAGAAGNIKVPATARNQQALGFIDGAVPVNNGWKDFKVDGPYKNIITGRASVKEMTLNGCKKFYTLRVESDAMLWMSDIDKPLCEFAPDPHVFDKDTMQASWDGSQEYVYAPIAYDWHLNVDDPFFRHTFPWSKWRPSFFILPILERMFWGWKLQGSFLRCLKDLVIPYTFGKLIYSDERWEELEGNFKSCVVYDGGGGDFYFQFSGWSYLGWVYDSGANLWQTDIYTNVGGDDYTTLFYQVPQTSIYCFSYYVEFDSTSYMTIRLEKDNQDPEFIRFEPVETDAGGTYYFEGIYNISLQAGTALSIDLVSNIQAPDRLINAKFTIERKQDVVLGDTIYPSDFFPKDKTGLDIFKSLIQLFNLNVKTDPIFKTVTIEARDGDVFNNKGVKPFYEDNGLDWTGKVDESKPNKYKRLCKQKRKLVQGFCEDSGDYYLEELKAKNGRQPFEGGFDFGDGFANGTEYRLNDCFAPTLVAKIDYTYNNSNANEYYPLVAFDPTSATIPIMVGSDDDDDEVALKEGMCEDFKMRLMHYAGVDPTSSIILSQESEFPSFGGLLTAIPILQQVDYLGLGSPNLSFSNSETSIGLTQALFLQQFAEIKRGHNLIADMCLNECDLEQLNCRTKVKLILNCDSAISTYKIQYIKADPIKNKINITFVKDVAINQADLRCLCEGVGSGMVTIDANNFNAPEPD